MRSTRHADATRCNIIQTEPSRGGTGSRPHENRIMRAAVYCRVWTPRPVAVVADKAYSHPSTRRQLRRQKVRFVSPELIDQATRRVARGSRDGRPPVFDEDLYRGRNVIERWFNRLKQFRGLATRYAKWVAYYRLEVLIAATILWLR